MADKEPASVQNDKLTLEQAGYIVTSKVSNTMQGTSTLYILFMVINNLHHLQNNKHI